jgi:hypothetical protein
MEEAYFFAGRNLVLRALGKQPAEALFKGQLQYFAPSKKDRADQPGLKGTPL